MPRAAKEMGAVNIQLPLGDIAMEVLKRSVKQ
jgi:chemotaxis response regulator CheB